MFYVLCVIIAIVLWCFRGALYNGPYLMFSAWLINVVSSFLDYGIRNEKKRVFQLVDDHRKKIKTNLRILEVGAGTLPNLEYLPADSEIVCLDPNQYFNKHAEKNIKAQSKITSVEFVQGVAEDIPIESDKFDVIICTLVLCSVTDIPKCLKEIRRVLKPGGLFVFVEHVAAENKTWQRLSQTFFNPVHNVVFDGCCVNRNTEKAIRDSGMKDVHVERFRAKYPFWFSPCISGSASK